jgi:hypothetical protein
MEIIDILLENQAPTNKIINAILINSGLENSERKEAYIQKINELYPKYLKIKNDLTPDRPQAKTFLTYFDGNHDRAKYRGNIDIGDLKNPTTYTLEQFEFLVDEFDTEPGDVGAPADAALLKDTQYSEENAEISKQLWYNESTAKISLPGFRVFQPMNQADSVKYGWYEEKLQQKIDPSGHSWCVTWRGNRNNRWGAYRGQGGTFYFIIDESKLEAEQRSTQKYYLGALQVFPPEKRHPTGYELTDIVNTGEIKVTWDEVVRIYPQLADYKDQLTVLPFNNDELEVKSVVSLINERPGDKNNFSGMPRRYKLQYINDRLKISTPESWMSMDKKLREAYITLTNSAGEFRTRFPNFELLRAMKNTNTIKLLNSEMIRKGIANGVKELTHNLMQDLRVKKERVGIVNENIELLITQDKTYGLYDNNEIGWLVKNGDEYSPSYRKVEEKVIENPTNKERFYVDKFLSADGDYFIAITPIDDIDSYFLSKNAWEKIQNDFTENPTERMAYKTQDINEE